MLEESLLSPARPAPAALEAEAAPFARSGWRHRYALITILSDLALLSIASATAYELRFGDQGGHVGGLSYLFAAVVVVPVWLLFLAAGRCYEHRYLGVGAEEMRRVFNSSIRLVAAVALLGFATGVQISRIYVVVGLLLGVGLLMAERLVAHRVLQRLRGRGHCLTRVVVVGDRKRIVELVSLAAREVDSGFTVV